MKKKADVLVIGKRIYIAIGIFFIAFAALIGRLFILQIVLHKNYTALAARQYTNGKEAPYPRGTIFAQDKGGNRVPLAVNIISHNLILSPKAVKDPEKAIRFLTDTFHIPREEIEKNLRKKNDPYELLLRAVNSEDARKVETAGIAGVFLEEEKRRNYPQGALAAHVLGFVSRDNEKEIGKYGIERFYQRELDGTGRPADRSRERPDFFAALGGIADDQGEGASDITLTIDYHIQQRAEEVVEALKEKWAAKSGLILVLEPSTGRILAEAARPVFDPNAYSKEASFSVFLNPAEESMYEFGSVVKPLVMAAGIEEKKVTPSTTYEDAGTVKVGGFTIKNFDENAYGIQTMTQVLEKSLNTGIVFVSRLLGKEKERDYFARFGFGEKTGVDLPGEIAGNLQNLASGRQIDYDTAAFGQGIAVTPIQMASAFAALANKGKLMKPYVVEKITTAAGEEMQKEPVTVREAVSPETAEKISQMLVSAVRKGFENRSGVKGYFVAGKTGTAQLPKKDGRGYSDQFIHTFIGYAPAFNPRFLVLLQLVEPKGNKFAANTMTPAFHDLAEFILQYYQVPPDEK